MTRAARRAARRLATELGDGELVRLAAGDVAEPVSELAQQASSSAEAAMAVARTAAVVKAEAQEADHSHNREQVIARRVAFLADERVAEEARNRIFQRHGLVGTDEEDDEAELDAEKEIVKYDALARKVLLESISKATHPRQQARRAHGAAQPKLGVRRAQGVLPPTAPLADHTAQGPAVATEAEAIPELRAGLRSRGLLLLLQGLGKPSWPSQDVTGVHHHRQDAAPAGPGAPLVDSTLPRRGVSFASEASSTPPRDSSAAVMLDDATLRLVASDRSLMDRLEGTLATLPAADRKRLNELRADHARRAE